MPRYIYGVFLGFHKQGLLGGLLLFFSALLAFIAANSFLSPYYDLLLSTPVEVRVGDFDIAKPLLLWINDGLMAIFFFIVGLELKRELVEGELSSKDKILLPGVGAIGGMLAPALIYVALNYQDPVALEGWAIPAATDIAFALGVLALLGDRVPVALKVFLTSLAVFDDIGAIIIIALFYTSKISAFALIVALLCIIVLWFLNRRGVVEHSPYMIVGLIMWVATLKSGVHATLAGVILGLFIPMRSAKDPNYSPVEDLEHDIAPLVNYFVLPVFAFANAGVYLGGVSVEQVTHSVPMGIALGLILGKQVGIFSFCWLLVKLKFAELPRGMSWSTLYGTSALCGVGFTMSLFIGALAFEDVADIVSFDDRLGILLGSSISGVLGYFILRSCLPKERSPA